MKRRLIAIAAVAAGALIAGGMAPQLGWLWAAGRHAPPTEVKRAGVPGVLRLSQQ